MSSRRQSFTKLLGIWMPRLGKQIQLLTLKRKVSLDHREVLNRLTNNWRDRVHMGILIDGSKSFTV